MGTWTNVEERTLRERYPTTAAKVIHRLMPRHSAAAIYLRAFSLGIQKEKKPRPQSTKIALRRLQHIQRIQNKVIAVRRSLIPNIGQRASTPEPLSGYSRGSPPPWSAGGPIHPRQEL